MRCATLWQVRRSGRFAEARSQSLDSLVAGNLAGSFFGFWPNAARHGLNSCSYSSALRENTQIHRTPGQGISCVRAGIFRHRGREFIDRRREFPLPDALVPDLSSRLPVCEFAGGRDGHPKGSPWQAPIPMCFASR
jgi:hypothetical protein